MDIPFEYSSALLWILESAAQAILGASVLASLPKLRTPLAWAFTHGSRHMRGAARYLKRERLLRIRQQRFDLAWIQRDLSRATLFGVVCILWFGGWSLALGLLHVLSYSNDGAPLNNSFWPIILSSAPLYMAEIGWIYYSSRASDVIKYRQKVRIWRFNHRHP